MTNPVNPGQANREKISNFKNLPAERSQPTSNIDGIQISALPGGANLGGGTGGGTGPIGGGGGNPPPVVIDPGTWTLPANFTVTFTPQPADQPGKYGIIVVDPITGTQSVSLDITCSAVLDADRFEIRYA